MLAAKRQRETDRRSELLPAILRHCELHSPHISLQDIAAFLESGDISADYYDAHSAEEISHHIASVWAAKLLLQVGTSLSSGTHTSHRQRVSPGASTGAPTTATMQSADDEAGIARASAPHSHEEARSCEDMDSASDIETIRNTDNIATRLDLHIDIDHGDGADGDDCDADGMMGGGEYYGNAKCSKQSRRLVWTDDLHRRFENAVAKLGSENAKPQAIQQLMNVEGITTRNIKSHLQKYRLRLQKQPSHCSGGSSHLMPHRVSHNVSLSSPMPSSAGRSSALAAHDHTAPSPRHQHSRSMHTPSATTMTTADAQAASPNAASPSCFLATPNSSSLPQVGGYELTQSLSNTSMQSKLLDMIASHNQQHRPVMIA